MPEPLSIAASLWLGTAALNACARQRSAFSSEAQDLADTLATVIRTTESSQFLFGQKATAISELKGIAIECAETNWDGYEAEPLQEEAVFNAEAFIRAMPDDMPVPEVAAEPDGSISLDWIASRHRLFSVSVGADNRLACAWLDGADRGHAVVGFDGMNFPDRVRDGLNAVLGHDNTAIRIA